MWSFYSLDQVAHNHDEVSQSENKPDDDEYFVGDEPVAKLVRLPRL